MQEHLGTPNEINHIDATPTNDDIIEEPINTSPPIILKKKNKTKNNAKTNPQVQKAPVIPAQNEQNTFEKFFLKDPKDEKKQMEMFEKESLDNDFLIVKSSEKNPAKVVHKSKQAPK